MTGTRSLIFGCALAFVAVACTEPTVSEVDLDEGRAFVPAVVDFLDNTGVGPSMAVSSEGVPFVSSFGFTAELEEGEIPVTRPVNSPFLPAVLLASEDEGIFTRGAVAMGREAPSSFVIPFGPSFEKDLAEVAAADANGTSVALDAQGQVHVAWVVDNQLWYATSGAGTTATVEQVPVEGLGTLGWPGIAIDDTGRPWIGVAGGDAIGLRVKDGDRWSGEVLECPGCGSERVAVGATAQGPLVAYADAGRGAVVAYAPGERGSAKVTDVETGVSGTGLSMALDPDGNARLAYYSGDGAVHEARQGDAGWSASAVAEVGEAEEPAWETTGIAVDGEGASYVGYYDGGSDSVKLVSDVEGDEFRPLPTRNTDGGTNPTVGVTEDGANVFVAWYDRVEQDLLLGTLEETSGLAIAEPSPQSTAAPVMQPTGKPQGKPQKALTIVAPVGASGTGFQETQLFGTDNKELSVTFDNQDTGQIHNWALYETDAADQLLGQAGDYPNDPPGPITLEGTVDPLKAGEYFYRCDYHPAIMTGTLFVE